jgi:DNA-binding NarL/FixJ family response regulator
MELPALRDALAELARECGVSVRVLRSAGDASPGLASGPALVRDAPWVVLVASDPAAVQVAALATGLVRFASSSLDARYLPPAVRAALDRASEEQEAAELETR